MLDALDKLDLSDNQIKTQDVLLTIDTESDPQTATLEMPVAAAKALCSSYAGRLFDFCLQEECTKPNFFKVQAQAFLDLREFLEIKTKRG